MRCIYIYVRAYIYVRNHKSQSFKYRYSNWVGNIPITNQWSKIKECLVHTWNQIFIRLHSYICLLSYSLARAYSIYVGIHFILLSHISIYIYMWQSISQIILLKTCMRLFKCLFMCFMWGSISHNIISCNIRIYQIDSTSITVLMRWWDIYLLRYNL